MKRFKPILMQVGILLLIISIFLYILGQKKHFISIDFSKQYAQNKTVEIAAFDTGESWQGNYSNDSERVLEGKSSITLSSWYGKENKIQKNQDTIIPPGYTKGFVSAYIADKQNLASLISFSLQIIGENDQKKEFILTPLIAVGWNRIPVSFPDWKKITSVSFAITSKPQSITEINLDRFWIENTSNYIAEPFHFQNRALSLRTIGERTYLFSTSTILETYSLISPAYIQNGSFIISLIPEHAKEIQLSLNGTVFKLLGKNMNECQLSRAADAPQIKMLRVTSGKDNLYTFIKADVQNNEVIYSISNNGTDYETCGKIKSSQKNRVVLSLMGSYLIDSYSVEY